MLSIILLASLAAVVALLYPVYEYFVDRHGLRKYPGPLLAALTPWYIVSISFTGQRFRTVDAWHQKYGPIVRLTPSHVSFTDPKAFRDIHGHGSSIIKDDFYSHIAGDNPSMAQTTSRAEHSRKRRFMSHVFSPREVTAMEPRVIVIVETLLRCLKIKAAGGMVAPTDAYPVVDGAFDLRPWLNMFSYDAITSMFWSSSYGLLDKGNDICPALTESGKAHYVHAMASFHGTTAYLVPLAQLSAGADSLVKKLFHWSRGRFHVDNFTSMVRWLVTRRLENPPTDPDFFSSLPITPTEKRPEPIPVKEVLAECTTMLDAGNDTTQTSLTNCIYQLASHPHKQARLRSQLTAALIADDLSGPVVDYAHLQHVTYLRAVLDESFRCRPPVGFGLPRRTTEPTDIAGHLIGSDVTVSAPLYNIHKDARLFTLPDDFVPERWLDAPTAAKLGVSDSYHLSFESQHENLKDFVLPFSLGGRACIGRNLAYMELSIVIAALILGFEWEIAAEKHADGKMDVYERLNSNPKNLWVRARPIEKINQA